MVESSLMEALATAAQGGSGTSVLSMLKYAVLPIAKVFTVCFMGFLMASKSINILQPNGRKLLNGVRFVSCNKKRIGFSPKWGDGEQYWTFDCVQFILFHAVSE
jgi:hypothetical protein